MPSKNRSRSTPLETDQALRPKEREIYEAAARIFYEKGYAATKNQDVAEEVGMLKGSLYYYIDTKEDMLYGVMRMAYSTLGDHLEATEAFDGTELERIRFFIVGHTRLVMVNLIPIAVLERELRFLSPARRREVIGWRDRYEGLLRDLLRAGQKAGTVRTTIAPELQSILAFTQMHGLHNWYRESGSLGPDEVAVIIADFVLNGIAP